MSNTGIATSFFLLYIGYDSLMHPYWGDYETYNSHGASWPVLAQGDYPLVDTSNATMKLANAYVKVKTIGAVLRFL